MSKRFFTKINKNGRNVIIDKECHIEIIDLTLACEVLNRLDLKLKTYNEQLGEQQDTISRLEEENEKLRFLIDINSVSERTKLERQVDEQQATIRKLQDLCGESDSENAKLRLKNKELQDKIDWLCEKYDYPKGVKNE